MDNKEIQEIETQEVKESISNTQPLEEQPTPIKSGRLVSFGNFVTNCKFGLRRTDDNASKDVQAFSQSELREFINDPNWARFIKKA